MKEDILIQEGDVIEEIIASFTDNEATGRQPKVVDIENHHHQEWRHATHQVVQKGCPVTAEIGPRRQEHEAPDCYMEEDIQFLIHA